MARVLRCAGITVGQGMLARPIKASVRTRWGFYLLLPEEKPPFPDVDIFCDWVIEECRNDQPS